MAHFDHWAAGLVMAEPDSRRWQDEGCVVCCNVDPPYHDRADALEPKPHCRDCLPPIWEADAASGERRAPWRYSCQSCRCPVLTAWPLFFFRAMSDTSPVGMLDGLAICEPCVNLAKALEDRFCMAPTAEAQQAAILVTGTARSTLKHIADADNMNKMLLGEQKVRDREVKEMRTEIGTLRDQVAASARSSASGVRERSRSRGPP